MWIPKTEAEIRAALDNGSVVETSSFDAKEALPSPGKNKDLAKDILRNDGRGGFVDIWPWRSGPHKADSVEAD